MWKVYDSFNNASHGDSLGPMPCKRWIKSLNDKPHKMSRRYGRLPTQSLDANDKRRIDERKAKEYAYWLAKRDKITLPDTYQVEYEWTYFYSAHRKRKQKFWNGVREVEVMCKRIKAVHFRISSNKVTTIELPNWDFDPCEPVEEITIENSADLLPQVEIAA